MRRRCGHCPRTTACATPRSPSSVDALDAELVAGDHDDLNREVRHVKVAAMSVPNLLDHVEEGTVFIAPGDRPDVIVTAALTRHSGAVPSVAGVVLSGGLRPDQRVADLIGGLGDGGKPLPMLAVDADTFDTANAAAGRRGGDHAGQRAQDRGRPRAVRGPRRPGPPRASASSSPVRPSSRRSCSSTS